MHNNLQLFREHARGRLTLSVRFGDKEIYDGVATHKSYQTFVEALFEKEHKMRVKRFRHRYDGDRVADWGLVFEMEDSTIYPMVKVTGILGESLEELSNEKS